MAATTPPRSRRRPPLLLRFDSVERVVHWVNAALFLILIATGATLYLSALAQLVGRRALIQDIHLAAGLALPLPVLIAVAGRWGAQLRSDLRRFNRWTRHDRLWLRAVFKDRLNRSMMMK